MTEHDGPPPLDTPTLAANLARVGQRSAEIVSEFMAAEHEAPAAIDSLDLMTTFTVAGVRALADPAALAASQVDLARQYGELILNVSARAAGEDVPPVVEPATGDRRFLDPTWSEHPAFDFMKQSYLLASRWIEEQMSNIDGLDETAARKVQFFTRQFIEAMAPSNFAFTNPEVVRATIETNGENLVRGVERLQADLKRGHGQLDMTTTDMNAFSVGEDLAVTPGKVVFQNRLMQLIQYEPVTEEVHRRPLLIVPPWINKFYVLDLRPENSFVRWAVAQGHTVFMISWANPDESLAETRFEDYVLEGPVAAMDAIRQATGERKVATIGYCIGGTLLAVTLAYLEAIGDRRIASATFFAAQVDFAEAGDLAVFTDEEAVRSLERRMAQHGNLLDAQAMSTTFNMLRPNDLIWSNVINLYLLGNSPRPMDLLYWNADATRIPGPVHSFYLRNMYLKNLLALPGGIEIAGVPIDLRRITTPMYVQASEEDHIAPAVSVFKVLKQVAGPVRFMLSGSGHIAGVINPPSARKYHYRVTSDSKKSRIRQAAESLEAWSARAQQHAGSWWPDWAGWQARRSGKMVPARHPGDGGLEPIEAAPGSYVLTRSTPVEEPNAAA